MKKLSILFAILTIAAVSLFAQTVTLTFTGQDDANHYVRLDSVVVRNITQGWQETLFWPDTVLIVQEGTGIEDYSGTNNASKIQLSQNTPNPFTGITFADMALAEEGKVLVEVTDMAGRVVVFNNYPFLQKGLHQLRISLSSPGVYFLTARMNGNASSVKMINQREGGADKIEYQGVVEKPQALFTPKSGSKDSIANSFHLGDEMEYVGFATVNGLRRGSVHITQAQNESQTIRLTFILPHDAQPCPGTPTVTDIDGNTYNTVWIGNQCWMKENLRTTHYSDGGAIAAGNSSFSETTPY
ncbi:MAG: T9SS type A sorting domain-containing protein, partial [Bacteroidales bacterium]|nr:T9SS type A sorting domain-containing protein [Bacteroidales bacterium]